MNRYKDWLSQAHRDLDFAISAYQNAFFEWACFISEQAAEKAIKAVAKMLNCDVWGHSLGAMLIALKENVSIDIPKEIIVLARRLDKFYIQPRYPNGFDSGAPFEHFIDKDAEDAIGAAKILIQWCDSLEARHKRSD